MPETRFCQGIVTRDPKTGWCILIRLLWPVEGYDMNAEFGKADLETCHIPKLTPLLVSLPAMGSCETRGVFTRLGREGEEDLFLQDLTTLQKIRDSVVEWQPAGTFAEAVVETVESFRRHVRGCEECLGNVCEPGDAPEGFTSGRLLCATCGEFATPEPVGNDTSKEAIAGAIAEHEKGCEPGKPGSNPGNPR